MMTKQTIKSINTTLKWVEEKLRRTEADRDRERNSRIDLERKLKSRPFRGDREAWQEENRIIDIANDAYWAERRRMVPETAALGAAVRAAFAATEN